MIPCLFIFEDLDSLVVDECRGYFNNEIDGLEPNDGILMIDSTNHLDRRDPAITKRPSRFDRKYHFRLPNMVQQLGTVDFAVETCDPIAAMTEVFSFAYPKEFFITSLLRLTRGADSELEDATDEVECRTSASDNTSVTRSINVEHSGRVQDLCRRYRKLDPTSKVDEDAKAPTAKKVKRVIPRVGIAESVRDNTLLKIVAKQARMLLDEMDNAEEVGRSKEAPMSISRPVGILRAQYLPGIIF